MKVRKATTADAGQLARLHRSAVVAGYAHIFPETSVAPDIASLRADWSELISDEDTTVIVAESGTTLVGSVALAIDPTVPANIVMKRLHVEPARWGRGIGSTLHDAAMRFAREHDHQAINLWVLERNTRAREMYERRGWKLADPPQVLANDTPQILDVLYERAVDLAPSFESVSTWTQSLPPFASVERATLIRSIARDVVTLSSGRLRVAVDGYTASGKTSFGHELAAAIRELGRPTLRASFDDFKKPWRDAIAHGYDRTSGEGYYRNAPDFESALSLLLEPAGARGSGTVALCAHDPLTGNDHRDVTVTAPPDSLLIVDSVFAFRPEYDEHWDYRIWLDITPGLSLRRGIDRDSTREGRLEAEQLHKDRYHASERIYIDEVDPVTKADIRINNADFAAPQVIVHNAPTQ